MKQGTLITKIVIFVLFAGVALYLAIYAVRSLKDPFTSVLTYQDTLDDAVEVPGVLVRKESALSSGAAIMDVLPGEGERVAAGETVAILYQNSDALERKKQLSALELEREQLQYVLRGGGSLEDAAQLEKQILNSILTLRSANGDLSNLETNAQALRTQVLQREFAYSATGGTAAALTGAMAELDAQIAALQGQSTYDTTAVYAPCSGLFSGLVDGWESTLTPDILDTITVGEINNVLKGTSSAGGTYVGKLITGDRWYFAAVVDDATAARLDPGGTITVAFSRDFTGEVTMRVDRIGPSESEGRVLVLSCDRSLKDVTQLRGQTVSLVFQRFTGIRVPKQALRMETRTVTDPDTEEEVRTQVLGVYAVVGNMAEFKQVEIVREGNDYYLVSPVGSTVKARLRPGDEIIVEATDLYDGKVIRE